MESNHFEYVPFSGCLSSGCRVSSLAPSLYLAFALMPSDFLRLIFDADLIYSFWPMNFKVVLSPLVYHILYTSRNDSSFSLLLATFARSRVLKLAMQQSNMDTSESPLKITFRTITCNETKRSDQLSGALLCCIITPFIYDYRRAITHPRNAAGRPYNVTYMPTRNTDSAALNRIAVYAARSKIKFSLWTKRSRSLKWCIQNQRIQYYKFHTFTHFNASPKQSNKKKCQSIFLSGPAAVESQIYWPLTADSTTILPAERGRPASRTICALLLAVIQILLNGRRSSRCQQHTAPQTEYVGQ